MEKSVLMVSLKTFLNSPYSTRTRWKNANDRPLVGIFSHSKHGLANNGPEIVWMDADNPRFDIHW